MVLYPGTEGRILTYNKIKKLYNERSRFVHLGETNRKSFEELRESCEYLEKTVEDVLGELEGYLYPRWDSAQNKEIWLSFEDFINEIKFSRNLTTEN